MHQNSCRIHKTTQGVVMEYRLGSIRTCDPDVIGQSFLFYGGDRQTRLIRQRFVYQRLDRRLVLAQAIQPFHSDVKRIALEQFYLQNSMA